MVKTEEVTREPLAAVQLVSMALQDLAPSCCEVVSHRGKPVPFSSAGYVLQANKKYRLRVIPPQDKDVLEVQINNAPDFLRVGSVEVIYNEGGQRMHEFPIRVKGLRALRCDDQLDVVLKFHPGSAKHAPPYICPIVVRPGWTLAISGVLITTIGFLGPAIPHLFKELSLKEEVDANGAGTKMNAWVSNPLLWIFLSVLVLIIVGVYGYSWWLLAQRRTELQEVFEDKYPFSEHKQGGRVPIEAGQAE